MSHHPQGDPARTGPAPVTVPMLQGFRARGAGS